MKSIFKRVGIVLSLFLSFLFVCFSSVESEVYALEDGETYQEQFNLSRISRRDNTIEFTSENSYSIKSITYEFTCYLNGELVSQLISDSTDFRVKNTHDYSFDVAIDTVGVKIWKIRYIDENGLLVNKFTSGSNCLGNVDTNIKLNYVEIKGDLYSSERDTFDNYAYGGTTSRTYYSNRLYFNFEDLDVDEVTKVVVDYNTYEHYGWWLFGWHWENKNYKNIENYEISGTHYDVSGADLGSIIKCILGYCSDEYLVRYINESDRDGYEYCVDLPDTTNDYNTLTQSQTVMENVAIVKITYFTEGEWFEDIDVLMEDTGYVYYHEGWDKPEWLADVFDWFHSYWWILMIIVLIPIISFISPIVKVVIFILKYFIKGLWIIIKYTIGLPFVLIRSKRDNNKTKINNKNKNNSLKKYGYNKNRSYYRFN